MRLWTTPKKAIAATPTKLPGRRTLEFLARHLAASNKALQIRRQLSAPDLQLTPLTQATGSDTGNARRKDREKKVPNKREPTGSPTRSSKNDSASRASCTIACCNCFPASGCAPKAAAAICSTIAARLKTNCKRSKRTSTRRSSKSATLLTENQSPEELQAGIAGTAAQERIGNFSRAHRFQARFSLRHRRPQPAARSSNENFTLPCAKDSQRRASFARDRTASFAHHNYRQRLRGPLAR